MHQLTIKIKNKKIQHRRNLYASTYQNIRQQTEVNWGFKNPRERERDDILIDIPEKSQQPLQ